jgi:hypothetical protein
MSPPPVLIRPSRADDLPRLQVIRNAAFAPVFASFRALLGDELYGLAQRRSDEEQGDLLASMLAPTPPGSSTPRSRRARSSASSRCR